MSPSTRRPHRLPRPPRHRSAGRRRPRARYPHRSPSPRSSDILFIVLSASCLLLTAFVAGALAAHPF